MKKRLFVALALTMAVSVCGGGCSHVHAFSESWSFNETAHFHKTTCGHDEIADSAPHTFGAETVVKAANCTEDGKKEKQCSVCGYKAVETIPAAHQYEMQYDNMHHYMQCSVCEDKIDIASHTYGAEQVVEPAGCNKAGKKEKECSVCGYKDVKEIPAETHHYEIQYDDEHHYSECGKCGDKKDETAHDGDPCSVCGHTSFSVGLQFVENGADAYQVKGIGECTDSVVKIPSSYNNKPVTAIDGYAFYEEEITQVVIPETVTSIGIAAFMYCGNLTKINIPTSVVSLGGNAFNGCTELTEIELPDTITEIGGFCFTNTGIYNASKNWTDNVLYIGNYAIKGDEEKFTGPLEIRAGTLAIATYAFSGCTHMTEINIPASVKHIGIGAFSECLDTTVMTVDAGNEVYYAEGNCIIEREAKRIVSGCPASAIPKDIKIIGEDSFKALDITEITIPVSVGSIERNAFGFCDKLEDFNYEGSLDQWKLITLGMGWKSDGLSWWTVHCTDGFINPMGETKK